MFYHTNELLAEYKITWLSLIKISQNHFNTDWNLCQARKCFFNPISHGGGQNLPTQTYKDNNAIL